MDWSSDGRHLATGGNDNIVNIYSGMEENPLYSFTDHQAAIKVLGCDVLLQTIVGFDCDLGSFSTVIKQTKLYY